MLHYNETRTLASDLAFLLSLLKKDGVGDPAQAVARRILRLVNEPLAPCDRGQAEEEGGGGTVVDDETQGAESEGQEAPDTQSGADPESVRGDNEESAGE